MASSNNNNLKSTTSIILIIRIAVGGYLDYLAFSLYDSLEMPIGSNNIVFVIATAVFFIAGLVLVVFSLRDLLMGRYEGGINDPNPVSQDEIDDIGDNQ